MRDAARLRRWLSAALVAAGCGGAGKPAPASRARPDAGVVSDTRSGVMRTPPENCLRGQWCGPVDKVRRFAAGVELRGGCPVEVSDNDGTSFRLRDEDTAQLRAEGDETACCYDFEARCWDDRTIEGRPYLEAGVARFASAAAVDGLAGLWLEDALAEHASVASFARHALELMALAAPAELLRDVLAAGLDEVRHAERAFAIASRLAGQKLSGGPLVALPPRPLDLDQLAASVLVEGCWNESVAALAAGRAARHCEDPEIRKHLRAVSRDEARHAALAWRTLAWARGQGARVPGLPAGPAQVTAPRDPRLAAAGRLSAGELAAVRADAWQAIVVPLMAETCARS